MKAALPFLAMAAVGGFALAVPTPAPLNANEHAELAIVYMKLGDQRTPRHYAWALELDPKHTRANFGAGMLALDLRRYKDSERHLRAALEGDPENLEIALSLGALLQRQKRLDEAAAIYRELDKQLAAKKKRDLRIFYNMGNLELSRNRLRESRAWFATYVKHSNMFDPRWKRVNQKIVAITRELGDAPVPGESPTPDAEDQE